LNRIFVFSILFSIHEKIATTGTQYGTVCPSFVSRRMPVAASRKFARMTLLDDQCGETGSDTWDWPRSKTISATATCTTARHRIITLTILGTLIKETSNRNLTFGNVSRGFVGGPWPFYAPGATNRGESSLQHFQRLWTSNIAVLSLWDYERKVVLQRLDTSCKLTIGGPHNHVVLGRGLRVQDLEQHGLVPALLCALAPAHITPQVTFPRIGINCGSPTFFLGVKNQSCKHSRWANMPGIGACRGCSRNAKKRRHRKNPEIGKQ
jgi:hypothetical protein